MSKKKIITYIALGLLGAAVLFYVFLWWYGSDEYDVEYGISFNQYHAKSLGVDWKENYLAMLDELNPKYIRIAAMWNEVEPKPFEYDFSRVDWMMDQAKKHDTKVLLVVGQKAPRWPECHIPDWAEDYSDSKFKEHLIKYTEKVAKRYKKHEALDMWQVENEPFIGFKFGKCQYYKRDLVQEEIETVKDIDTDHKIMITDSGELSWWRKPAKLGDVLGSTLYRVIRLPNDFVFSYDWLPAGWYKFRARLWDKSYDEFFISELQAEPWFISSNDPTNTNISKQKETMSMQRVKDTLEFVEHTGASRAYIWGVEWWYYMKEKRGYDGYWNLMKKHFN